MGMRWRSNVDTTLRNSYERSSHAALRALRRGATVMHRAAINNAPVDEGTLEDAIRIEESRGEKNRIQIRLFVDESVPVPGRLRKTVGSYAIRMHEGVYKLGELSREKQMSLPGVKVGRKYIERAVDDNIEETERDIRKAVDKALQGIGL